MSWLSAGLAKIGISKEAQRKVTAPLLAAAAPFTGGASAALIPFINKPVVATGTPNATYTPAASPQPVDINGAIVAGFATFFGAMKPTAPSLPTPPAQTAAGPTGTTAWDKWKLPVLIGTAAIAVLASAFAVLKR